MLSNIREFSANLAVAQEEQAAVLRNFYEQCVRTNEQEFEQAAERERLKYLATIEEYKVQLAQVMNEGVASYMSMIREKDDECQRLYHEIEQLQITSSAAVAAAKRAEEIKQEANFYKLQLTDVDLEEIRLLRNVSPYLRDKEPLNKVIWKVYYEKPTTDLIGRVIGSGIHTGIYKITNLDNQMCYVGQAANLADRWK